MEPVPLNWMQMATGLFGGLALFLYGLDRMSEALKAVAGSRLKDILARLTTNRFIGALTGAAATAVIQSSSVTTVLVVGFVSAGMMSLSQSVGVILGANIGTTVTAQIIAFKITKLALVFIALGFGGSFFLKKESLRQYGSTIFGLGLLFFGMNIMGDSMGPLRSYPPFIELMRGMETPLLGILCGALFTAVIQSSSATTGVVVVMASQGLISLPAGIALALGANIGTCATALLATLGKPRAALRAAAIHVLFNLAGALLWLGVIDTLAQLAVSVSPQYPLLQGFERLAAETPRQIANANTLFNIINTALFIGFAGPLGRLMEQLFPDKPELGRVIIEPKYLDRHLVKTPSMALEMARLEVGRLGDQVLLMMALAQEGLQRRELQTFEDLEKQDDAADILHAEINLYLSAIGKRTLTNEESREYFRISQANANLEAIGDVLETDLAELGRKLICDNLHPSTTMNMLLQDIYTVALQGVENIVIAIRDNDQRAAQEVIACKKQLDRRIQAAQRHQAESLAHSEQARLATLNAEFEIIDKFKRIHTLSKRIARFWVPKEV